MKEQIKVKRTQKEPLKKKKSLLLAFSIIPSQANADQMVPVNSPLEPGKFTFTQPS